MVIAIDTPYVGLALNINTKVLVSNGFSVVAYAVQLAQLPIWVTCYSSDSRGHKRVLHVIDNAPFESIAARHP